MTHSNSGNTSVTIEDGPTVSTALIAWALLAVTAFIAIASAAVAVAVAIGLARFDRRAGERASGRRHPASLGAGPRIRCHIAFWQSLLICGLGAALGAGLGILPAFALVLPGGALPFVPPWTQIATIFIALSAVIAVASWLLAGRATTVQRRVVVL